jgi:hypothetical protein
LARDGFLLLAACNSSDHCACSLSRRLPGGFVCCASSQEGKVRAVVLAREASAEQSIFRPTTMTPSQWQPLAPPCGREPPPRQPRRQETPGLMRCPPRTGNPAVGTVVFWGTSFCEHPHCTCKWQKMQIHRTRDRHSRGGRETTLCRPNQTNLPPYSAKLTLRQIRV